jgi:exosortase/archaeosortase family protein
MTTPAVESPASNNQPSRDPLVASIVFLTTGLIFLPVLGWLLRLTTDNDQLLHAFLVLAFTTILLVVQRHVQLRPVWKLNDRSLYCLLASYAVLLLAIFSGVGLLTLPALSLSVAAWLLFVFGTGQQRFLFAAVTAFALFTAFAALLPVLDWPLRSLAGQWSAAGLSWFGQQAELKLYSEDGAPMLLLFNEQRPFHVAAECNGFGLLTSSLMMACVLLLMRPLQWIDRLLYLASAMLIAFGFNTLRIIIIVLLAPVVGDDNYMLMHEIVGLAATYSGLGLLYFLIMSDRRRQQPAVDADAQAPNQVPSPAVSSH